MSTDPAHRFEIHLGADIAGDRDPEPSPVLEGDAFRIAILGDFSGLSGRPGAAPVVPLARRRAWRVDRDDLDRVMAGIAPELHLTLDPAEPGVAIAFSSLDDFHPDRLLERLPRFQQLRSLRAEVESAGPAAPVSPRPESGARSASDGPTLDLSSGSLLDRIIDSTDPQVGSRPRGGEDVGAMAPLDDLAAFVDRVVRPHAIRGTSADQRDRVALVDGVIAATLRVVLHHPDYQALEALWRGVDFVLRRMDTDESLQVFLIDVSRSELAADLASGTDLDRCALHRLLVDGSAVSPGARRWSLLVGAYALGPTDVPLLTRLATLGRMAGAPWLTSATPPLAGARSFASDPDPDEWTEPLPAGWDGLRAASDAAFLSLALPRFLLRGPYGADGEECETPFEEFESGPPAHESYLWGNPALLAALAIGEQVGAGHAPPTQAVFERMPLHVPIRDGEPTATPCAEALLTQRAVLHMLDRGLTPLASGRDADTILIPRLQSVALPPRPLDINAGTSS